MGNHRGERLGVLGGTFNPIHLGHLAMARAVLSAHGLSRVLLVVAATPPHKPTGELAGARHRLEMARIGASSEERIEASDIELRRKGISYTVETLFELSRAHPQVELFFIIGEDTIPELPLWKDQRRILELARIVAVNRPGSRERFNPPDFPQVPEELLLRCERDRVEMEPIPIASRDIRRAVQAGDAFDHWLPPGVGDYIREHELYGYRKQSMEIGT